MNKFFLYIRKSTDEDDRQVLSLEAQEVELKEFAHREQIEICETLRESQTAKEPGRPVFNEMIRRIERGEASGIVGWHPDRLARNSVDGGKIIYLLDTGKLRALKFPTFWCEATPQGKFMLSIAFGQSKYFVDNLSENTKRGLRQKLRRGELPGPAPLGYINDLRTHTIVPDVENARLVRKMFEEYATGRYSLKEVQNICDRIGLLSRKGKRISKSNLVNMLTNPLYYGVIRYKGEHHEARHEPIITKKLFDRCREVMAQKSRPLKRGGVRYPFRGLISCAECGCAITAETQKGHTYYRCTKKREACTQGYVREEVLASQISEAIEKVSLSPAWAGQFLEELDRQECAAVHTGATFAQTLQVEIEECQKKLDRLLDAQLEGMLERDEYLAKKQTLLSQKLDLQAKKREFERTGNVWLEPMRSFISSAKQAVIIASGENLEEKANFLRNIGSNPRLAARTLTVDFKMPWSSLAKLKTAPRSGAHSETILLDRAVLLLG